MDNPRVSMVAALGQGRELGLANELLWHIPEDLRRFKRLTLGHPVIMGRKTFESIVGMLGHPLPERLNVVVTRDTKVRELLGDYLNGSVRIANSIEEALSIAKAADHSEVFVIGGAQIYAAALPYTDRLYLTLINDSKEADAYFPDYERVFTKKIAEQSSNHNGLTYRWVDLEK